MPGRPRNRKRKILKRKGGEQKENLAEINESKTRWGHDGHRQHANCRLRQPKAYCLPSSQ